MFGIDDIISGGADILGNLFNGGDDTMEMLRRNRELYDSLGLGRASLNFEKYAPEMVDYETVTEDPRMREGQLSYLNKLAGLSETGLSDVDEATFRRANMEADKMGRQNRDAALAQANRRGIAGSGLQFAMQQQGDQDALQRSYERGLQQADTSARQRALYTQAYGNALGDQREQDWRHTKDNTDIINRFNQLNTGARNQARQYNIEDRRAVDTANLNNKYRYAEGVSGANKDMATGHAAQGAANAGMWHAGGKVLGGIARNAFGEDEKKEQR